MQICNACRYCEGFCAVFPAMTRRLEFDAADVALPRQPLPQLRRVPACLPVRAAARVRGQRSARDGAGAARRPMHATPGRARSGALYERNGLTVALALAGRPRAVPGARRWRERLAAARAAGRRFLPRLSARSDGRRVRRRCSAFAMLALGIGVRALLARRVAGARSAVPSAAAAAEAAEPRCAAR